MNKIVDIMTEIKTSTLDMYIIVITSIFFYLAEKVKTPWGGLLPYMGYIGMCRPKGYGFSAVLVINRVSILADYGHFGHK